MAKETTRAKKQGKSPGVGNAKVGLVERVETAKPVATVETEAPEENRARTVKNLLAMMEKKMTDETVKATLGDYIRLVQLHKELGEEEPREIRATWVEAETKE